MPKAQYTLTKMHYGMNGTIVITQFPIAIDSDTTLSFDSLFQPLDQTATNEDFNPDNYLPTYMGTPGSIVAQLSRKPLNETDIFILESESPIDIPAEVLNLITGKPSLIKVWSQSACMSSDSYGPRAVPDAEAETNRQRERTAQELQRLYQHATEIHLCIQYEFYTERMVQQLLPNNPSNLKCLMFDISELNYDQAKSLVLPKSGIEVLYVEANNRVHFADATDDDKKNMLNLQQKICHLCRDSGTTLHYNGSESELESFLEAYKKVGYPLPVRLICEDPFVLSRLNQQLATITRVLLRSKKLKTNLARTLLLAENRTTGLQSKIPSNVLTYTLQLAGIFKPYSKKNQITPCDANDFRAINEDRAATIIQRGLLQ